MSLIELKINVSPDFIVPQSLKTHTPEDNATMIILGALCVERMKTSMVSETLRNEIRASFETQIAELQVVNKYLRETPDTSKLEQMEMKWKIENTYLKAQVEQGQQQLKQLKVEMERKIEREIQRERDFSRIMLDEKEKQLNDYKCFKDVQHKSTSEMGSEGEKVMEEMCRLAFRDFDGFEIKDVHTQKSHGDRHLHFKEFVVLADAKKYNTPVPSTERQKIRDDLMKHPHLHFAWLISMDTPVYKYDKGVFAFEWINETQCVCYVNAITKHNAVEVLRSLYFVCKMLYDTVLVRKETQAIHQDMLENYKKEVIDNLEKYKTVKKERESAMRKLAEVLNSQDEIIRVMLNHATTEYANAHLNTIMEWIHGAVQSNPTGMLTSKSIWAKFKKECGEFAASITIDQFKDTLMSQMEGCSRPNGKDGMLEIRGIEWKKEEKSVAKKTSTKTKDVIVISNDI